MIEGLDRRVFLALETLHRHVDYLSKAERQAVADTLIELARFVAPTVEQHTQVAAGISKILAYEDDLKGGPE